MLLVEDRKMLSVLLDKYTLKELLRTMAHLTASKADYFSDLGLKERARDLISGAEQMLEMISHWKE